MLNRIRDHIARLSISHKYKKNLLFASNNPFRRDSEVIIIDGGKMEIGNSCQFNSRISLTSVSGHLKIGDRVSLNRNCIIICRDKIHIDNDCIFGPNVVVYDHDHRFSIDGIQKDGFRTAPITIEEGCWIGANVTILRGTHVGHDSIIGAGVVLKGDVPPHSLVVGDRRPAIVPIDNR